MAVSTPPVTYAYDRTGRPISVIRDSITTTLVYNKAGQLDTESYARGILDGFTISRTYDSLQRRSGLAAQQFIVETLYNYDS